MSRNDPQWERAHQSWELVVGVERSKTGSAAGSEGVAGAEAAESAEGGEIRLKALFRILRVKRSERDALVARIPGVVRRGARVDLQAMEQALREAGIPCVLRRRAPADEASSEAVSEGVDDSEASPHSAK